MKKVIALFLALTLAVSLGTPVIAAPEASTAPAAAMYTEESGTDTSDARLAAVTLKVKNRLGLNTEGYEEFSGNLNENAIAPSWDLYWSGTNGSLNITATEDGEILSLSRYEYDYYRDPLSSVFGPKYPVDGSAAARMAAEAFTALVLDPAMESVKLATSSSVRPYSIARPSSSGEGTYTFSSVIYLNQTPSPLSMSISVRGDGTVMSFHRDSLSGRYLGDIPPATPVAAESDARALLRGTLKLNLEYVLDADGESAVLRYLPVGGDEYYVDAATGALINRSDLFRNVTEIYDGGESGKSARDSVAAAPEASADSAAGGATLTQRELEGISKLDGVMTKEELDAALQSALPELGLAGYTLSNASYYVGRAKEDETVTCTLTYSRKLGDDIIRRMVTLDGKTAAFAGVYTYYPWQQEKAAPTVAFADAERAAQAFLTAHYSGEFAATEKTYGSDAAQYTYGLTEHSFIYTRKENGYFYRNNSVNVGIDPLDGSIAQFTLSWDHTLTFDSPEGIVSESAAIDAYLAAYAAPVRYIAVPKALDGAAPQYQILREQGYGYFFTLALGYQLSLEQGYFAGVDAKSGEAIVTTYTNETTPLRYDDIGGSWAKASIERLASYNVGYAGGKFQPTSQLTQLDLVALLVSTDGYLIDLAQDNAADRAYNAAYNLGLLQKSERDDGKVLTRMEMTKLILDASGYGRVAQLDGIFVCSFSDADQIPAALYGYAAVAQGLGILRGNSSGQCMPQSTATRAEAAAMLDQFMAR